MKQILLLLLLFITTGLNAQSVTFDFPFHPGRKIILSLINGTQNDTIFQGNLDNEGQIIIEIPKKYKQYCGIATMQLDLPNAYFEFIMAGEDMTLYCKEEYPYVGNTIFFGSPENEALQKWFAEQFIREQKIDILSKLLQLYDGTDNLYIQLEKEKEIQEIEQKTFEKELVYSKLYAAKFIQLHNFLNKEVSNLVFGDSIQMAKTRQYVTDSLDMQVLYTSGMWFKVLNGLLLLYDNGTPYHCDYIKDMILLLNRSNDDIYAVFVENLFTICESTGWNDLEEQLAYFFINDGRIKEPTEKMRRLMALYKVIKGSKALNLSFGENWQDVPTILVFYESGGGSCESEMQQLKENYILLKDKGYKVVSVSADKDADIFTNTANQFPWKDKYCDLQGFSGTDFKNFGIISTPTFFLIDKYGIVEGRYAKLQDTKLIENK